MDEPAVADSKHRIADFVVVVVLAAFVVLYCVDAVRASTDIRNLILVLPLSIAVLALCVAQFVVSARGLRRQAMSATDRPVSPDARPITEVLPVIGLFAAYVASLPWFGFDVGTCLFLAAFLRLHGERRWPWLIGYSVCFGLASAFFFSRMLPYAMPLLILGSG